MAKIIVGEPRLIWVSFANGSIMCFKSESLYNTFDKISCRILAIINVISNGVPILWWTYIWYTLHMTGGGVYINVYETFPIPVIFWLTLVILCSSVTYIISIVLLTFQIYNRCYGPVNVYYVFGVGTNVVAILVTAVQLASRHGEDHTRFFAEPTVTCSLWGLLLYGINLLLLIAVYYKLPKDCSPRMHEEAKPPEIHLQETASMLPSAPPLHLLEENI